MRKRGYNGEDSKVGAIGPPNSIPWDISRPEGSRCRQGVNHRVVNYPARLSRKL